MKQLWMLVGGNGVGKTTFYDQFLRSKGLPFINADVLAKKLYPHSPERNSLKAAKFAERIRMAKLTEGVSFCFETVFSHASKVDFLAHAKALGYRTHLIWIHLEQTDLNIARVAQRINEGGHSVPVDKIRTRIPRTMENVKIASPLCDEIWVLDNSLIDKPYEKVFVRRDGNVIFKRDPFPEWATRILSSGTR